jgi:hypothetical protein
MPIHTPMRETRSQRETDTRSITNAAGQGLPTVETKPTPRPAASEKPISDARSCGDCRVCCTLFEIPEVKKDLNSPCRHESRNPSAPGCKIYAHRPQVCRTFECAWKLGLGTNRDRPDRLGIMLYTINLEDGLPGLAIVEAHPGAFQTKRVRDMIALYQARKPGRIILRRAEDRRFKQASVLIEGKPLADAPAVVVPASRQNLPA